MPRKGVNATENAYPPLPLDPLKRQIRLLHVHRRGSTSEIHADVRVVWLDDGPAYEALSYTWGERTRGHTMVLNGGYRLEITDNLYNALHRFRARRDRLQIWVDAVCINQCDIPERNQQVAMMGDIYRNARQVCIWLGEPQKLMVMHFLAAVNDLLHFRVDRQDRRWHGVRSTSKRRAIRDADAATSPSWCNRAWVRQEYVLAPSVYFLVGSLSLKRTSDAIDAVPALGVTLEQMDRLQSYPDMVTAIVNPWIVRQAKDPRDLVYSLRGIIRPEEAQLIQPDYSLPCEVVFAQATYAHIKAKGSFRILERFLAARPSSAPSLPSWVVDFSHIDRGVDIAGEVRWPSFAISR